MDLGNDLARMQSALKIFVWPHPHFVRPHLFDHLLSRRDCAQVVSYPSNHSGSSLVAGRVQCTRLVYRREASRPDRSPVA